MDLMEATSRNADVAAMQQELLAIRDIYDQSECDTCCPQRELPPSGRMVLGEDVQMD